LIFARGAFAALGGCLAPLSWREPMSVITPCAALAVSLRAGGGPGAQGLPPAKLR